MKTILVLAACVLASAAALKCQPGSSFLSSDGCNRCVCSKNGETAACTLKLCFKKNPGTVDFCTPGTSVLAKDGCNHCICGPDGKARACTRMACFGHFNLKENTLENCMPGTSVPAGDGCNTCTCGPDGKAAACTLMACSNPLAHFGNVNLIAKNEEVKCTPGSSILSSDGCNTCFCGNDGKPMGCTMKFCIKKNPGTVDLCTPGTSVPAGDGCNTCICGPNGKANACTLMACYGPVAHFGHSTNLKIQLNTPEHCTPGTSVPAGDGCNTCVCGSNGKASMCTMMACLNTPFNQFPVLQEQFCQPGKTVPAGDGCNTCTCDDQGRIGMCTLMACQKIDVIPS